MAVTISGTYSGLDVSSIISALIAADSIPVTNLQTKDTKLSSQSTALSELSVSLGQVSLSLQSVGAANLFSSKTATSSNALVGAATVTGTASSGTTDINVTQLATSTALRSGSGANSKLTAPPSTGASITSVLNESSVQGQTFTVNGAQISLSDSDTLQSVIDKINSSSANVTASYDGSTGAISLSSGSPMVLGSGSDTSDFLQQAELFNNGTGAVTSMVGMGRVNADADLATAGLNTTPTAGTFTVNGVSISYTAGQTMNDVISAINSSNAGVTASYDSYEDQLVLTSNTRGPQSITVADGTSNLASALRLTSNDSTASVGKSTLFTINGSTTVRQSDSNIITAAQLGLNGVNFNATATGDTEITVAPDVTTIGNAINSFVSAYNAAQTLIATDLYVDPNDSTQNGVLSGDTNLTFLAPQLRAITSGSTNLTATVRMLSDLGISTNANDNTLTSVDTTKLQDALTNHLSDVQALFDDSTTGLTNTVQSVLGVYSDSLNGVIVNEQNSISSQVKFNKAQITTMQEQLSAEQTALENEFALLDQAEQSAQSLSGILSGSASTSSSSSGKLSSLGSVGSSTTS